MVVQVHPARQALMRESLPPSFVRSLRTVRWAARVTHLFRAQHSIYCAQRGHPVSIGKLSQYYSLFNLLTK